MSLRNSIVKSRKIGKNSKLSSQFYRAILIDVLHVFQKKMASKMDPSEVDFLSEKHDINILPNFKEGKIFLLSVRIRFSADMTVV